MDYSGFRLPVTTSKIVRIFFGGVYNSMLWVLGLKKLESLNLSFTQHIMDSGLRTVATITSLTSLNLDSKQITDTGLAALTGE
jgi:hypothetical protein